MRTTRRINLWSSPRNISTALMYAFAQRPDTVVVDEPLYAHYLTRQPTEADHPGRTAILAAQDTDGQTVVNRLLHDDYPAENVVFKQMTHHLVELDPNFLYGMTNVLLIRDPYEILASFGQVIDTVTAEDVGLPQQGDLFDRLTVTGSLSAVVDARRLLDDPAGILRALCERIDIAYDPAMLHWPAGPKAYDGVWADHWYAGVHRSTGFEPRPKKIIKLSPDLTAVAEATHPIYERLLRQAI
ncbi:hypothetical protein [Lewinella sp. IMCC34183]|uniref:sulfotransferase-like domain-containing protein n=1 Tax=Lewinella sp. IMCC34183 TaxID=2248762 RepID=UPI001E5AA196|nr:hypothetical protein [Lewinella sp. IMCC34183]